MSGASHAHPPIVAIGASAGGLEAIETFFDHVPPDTGAAFVVVQHLSPDFESLMDQLLARHTDLAIRQATDGEPLAPDTIYLIPPRADPSVVDGRIHLAPQSRPLGFPLPIDVFFRSLATDAGRRGIAVILSGTGTDGSRGALAVKDAGGFVAVQEPTSARFDGMPRAALHTGVADLVLPVDGLAERIVELLRRGGDWHDEPAFSADFGTGFEAVLLALRSATGVDFPRYKDRVLRRRVQRRMALNRCSDLASYVALLREDPAELRQLGRDALIRVTDFFRDPEGWRVLGEHLASAIRLARGGPFRAWVAGCSTGEEAYSLAMLIDEWAERRGEALDYRVFATDVDREAIALAQVGRYPASIVDAVGAERFERHFVREDDECTVRRELRQRVVFAHHDALRDPPFTRVHLTTCRNMLIYLQPDAQKDVLRRLHFSLAHGGLMWLGPSEVPLGLEAHVEAIDTRWRLLRKTGELPGPPSAVGELRSVDARRAHTAPVVGVGIAQALMEDLGAAGLLIDGSDQLTHVFGDAAAYLSIRPGRASRDLASLLASDHARTVLAAVHHVRRTGAAAECQRIPFQVLGKVVHADVRVLPIAAESGSTPREALLVIRSAPEDAPSRPRPIEFGEGDRLTELESELSRTRGNLQATIEELETANEELQSTNEELLASNEELQSTNEELHSVNEELHTVNAEHQRKIEELTQLADDVENLLASTEIGVVFLDRSLRIRRFTPAATEVLPILRSDVGRPIADLRLDVRGADLATLAGAVLDSGARVEREAIDGRGVRRLFRLLPYHTHHGVQGAVLSIVRLAAPGDPAVEPADFASAVARITATIDAATWTLELPRRDLRWFLDPAADSLLGFSRADLAAAPRAPFDAAVAEDLGDFEAALTAARISGQLHTVFRLRDPAGRLRHVQVDAFGVRGPEGDVTRLFGAVHELTRG